MFHRLLVEDWQRVLTIISFTIFCLVFVLTLARTCRMKADDVRRLENLPLGKDSDESAR